MPSDNETPSTRRPSRRWLFYLPLVALLAAWTAMFVGDTAQWKLASALNDLEAGEVDLAIDKLQQAIDGTSDNAMLKLQLARIYAENEQAKLGISLCDQVLKEDPKNVAALDTRSRCLQYLERFDEALHDYQKSVSDETKLSIVALNNIAYFRALADEDLVKAARQIDEAIGKIRTTPWGAPYAVPLKIRSVVAIGLIARHVKRETDALKQLDKHIDKLLDEWRRNQIAVKQLTSAFADLEFPILKPALNRINNVRSIQQVRRESLGLMLTVRALLHQDLASPRCVSKDLQLLKELSLDFDKIRKELPSDVEAVRVLETAMTFLDTRGFVSARMRWQKPEVQRWAKYLGMNQTGVLSSYEIALEDLDLAVESAELYHLAIRGPLYNRYELPPHYVKRLRHNSKRTIAVLRYHRMEAHLKQKNQAAASEDKARIKQLGLSPDARLF